LGEAIQRYFSSAVRGTVRSAEIRAELAARGQKSAIGKYGPNKVGTALKALADRELITQVGRGQWRLTE
jgi:hypothetical protein